LLANENGLKIASKRVPVIDEMGNSLSDADAQKYLKDMKTRVDVLRHELDVEAGDHQKVNPTDFKEALSHFGFVVNSMSEINHVIWEIDTDLDGAIDWEEFCAMFKVPTTRSLQPVSHSTGAF
jgi:hypothetical protein